MQIIRRCSLLLLILVLVACSPTASVDFQPAFAPIKFKVNERGEISVTAGMKYVTPIGTFTFQAGGKLPLQDPEPSGTTQLRIVRPVSDGTMAEHVYRLNLNSELAVCLDGRFYETFRNNVVAIWPSSTVSKIVVVDPRDSQPDCPAATARTTTQKPPPPSPPQLSPQDVKNQYIAEAEQVCYQHTSQKSTSVPAQPRPLLEYLRTIHTLRDREIVAWETVARPAEFSGSITSVINAHVAAHNAFGELISAFDYAVRAAESRADATTMTQANRAVDDADARYRSLNNTAIKSAKDFGFNACSHGWY